MSPEAFECATDGLGADGHWYDLAANDVWCFGIWFVSCYLVSWRHLIYIGNEPEIHSLYIALTGLSVLCRPSPLLNVDGLYDFRTFM